MSSRPRIPGSGRVSGTVVAVRLHWSAIAGLLCRGSRTQSERWMPRGNSTDDQTKRVLNKGHDLSCPAVTYTAPSGLKNCRICKRERMAEYRRLEKEAKDPANESAKKYVVVPGFVTSRNDFERHFISAAQVIKLYGVDPKACVILVTSGEIELSKSGFAHLIVLRPRDDGKYKLQTQGDSK